MKQFCVDLAGTRSPVLRRYIRIIFGKLFLEGMGRDPVSSNIVNSHHPNEIEKATAYLDAGNEPQRSRPTAPWTWTGKAITIAMPSLHRDSHTCGKYRRGD